MKKYSVLAVFGRIAFAAAARIIGAFLLGISLLQFRGIFSNPQTRVMPRCWMDSVM